MKQNETKGENSIRIANFLITLTAELWKTPNSIMWKKDVGGESDVGIHIP